MSRIPQNWIDENKELLTFILSNKLITGKKSLLTYDKLLNWIDENYQKSEILSSDEKSISKNTVVNLLHEMEYHRIISLKRISGVTYIIPEDDYFNLKTELTRKINTKLPNVDVEITESSSLTPLQHLYNKINSFSGNGKEFLIDLPKLIDLSARIMYDKRADWKIKSMISSVLGFALIGNNKIDEDYFDDLFAVSFVLKHIDNIAPYFLSAHWIYNLNLKKILNNAYQNSRLVISDKECRDILHLLGIPKIIKCEDDFEIRSAIGMISYLMGQVYGSTDSFRTVKYAEDKLLNLGIYDDIVRILDIAEGELVPKTELPEQDLVLNDDEYNLLFNGDL